MHTPYRIKDFPWCFFAALVSSFCLGHWIGASALHLVHELVPWTKASPHLFAPLCLLALLACGYALGQCHHRHPRPASFFGRLGQLLLGLLVLVLAFFTAATVEEGWLHGILVHHPIILIALCLALLIALNPVRRNLAQQETQPHNLRPHLQPRQPAERAALKVLILFVSPPSPGMIYTSRGARGEPASLSGKVARKVGDQTVTDTVTVPMQGGKEHLHQDILALKQAGLRWTWQQLMRALRGHDKLDKVILLGSCTVEPDAEEGGKAKPIPGTHGELARCKSLLDDYLRGTGCVVSCHPAALDFTDFNSLTAALRGIIHEQLKSIPKNQIGIDVTGGQATASIAGAAVTIDLETVFQYVNTNEPHQTLTYDVVQHRGPHLE